MEDQNAQNQAKLVQETLRLIERANAIADYRITQRKECETLVRRLNLLLPLLEDTREAEGPLPNSGFRCLRKMKKAVKASRKLLKTCHGGSKIYLALENEAIMGRFHDAHARISAALDEMPYEELGISNQVKQHAEMMHMQERIVKGRTNTEDMELEMDLMALKSSTATKNGDHASIERVARKLELQEPEELKRETALVRKLFEEMEKKKHHRRHRHHHVSSEGMQQIARLLDIFKRFAGLPTEEEDDDDDEEDGDDECSSVVLQPASAHQRGVSIAIPNEFLCPITLEIMSDPVIISTGQTYERESIQQWLDSNHTCPKTGQSLPHLLLAPNFALKNIIQEWCDANNFPIPNPNNHLHPSLSKSGNDAQKSGSPKNSRLQPLVDDLSSDLPEEQLKAVEEIRFLSKESAEDRVSVAECGGIPPLVRLLTRPDSRIREHAVTALLNLSIDESNKRAISEERPIPAIIEILKTGTSGARENSAAALFSLTALDENKEEIGLRDGIRPLIGLLEEGGVRGKKDAIAALFNACIHHGNKAAAVEAGIVDPLVRFLGDGAMGAIADEILSILLLLASHPAGRQEMGSLKFVETIVGIIGEGGRSPKNKECAAAVLLELGMHNSNLMLAALQFGVYDPLMEVAHSGTDRAQRKAKSILHHMSKAEQIP